MLDMWDCIWSEDFFGMTVFLCVKRREYLHKQMTKYQHVKYTEGGTASTHLESASMACTEFRTWRLKLPVWKLGM